MYKQPTFTSEGKEDKEVSEENLGIVKAFVMSPEHVIIKQSSISLPTVGTGLM